MPRSPVNKFLSFDRIPSTCPLTDDTNPHGPLCPCASPICPLPSKEVDFLCLSDFLPVLPSCPSLPGYSSMCFPSSSFHLSFCFLFPSCFKFAQMRENEKDSFLFCPYKYEYLHQLTMLLAFHSYGKGQAMELDRLLFDS